REKLPLAVPIAIVLWPGFLLTLTHDTTEILAAALLLAGLSAWLARRFVAGAAFLALATLTRETSILLVGGLASFAAVRCVRDRNNRAAWREAGCAVAAILAFLAWRHAMGAYWDDSAKAWGVTHNAGWPLVGIGQTVVANLLGHAVGLAHVPRSRAARPMTLLAISVLLWFCWHGVLGAARLLRNDRAAGLAAGWLLILALMSTLTANGPWIELSAFLRAFSECWILGWVLLGMSRAGVREWRWVALPGVPLFVYTWSLCWLQLR
ncbi:MAG TPA: hypothetical protein VMB71_03090, partial [Acetobacteraceae bacterium]|nr:hypothetical protein [Acetobacteraceae bacterium]